MLLHYSFSLSKSDHHFNYHIKWLRSQHKSQSTEIVEKVPQTAVITPWAVTAVNISSDYTLSVYTLCPFLKEQKLDFFSLKFSLITMRRITTPTTSIATTTTDYTENNKIYFISHKLCACFCHFKTLELLGYCGQDPPQHLAKCHPHCSHVKNDLGFSFDAAFQRTVMVSARPEITFYRLQQTRSS